jgi:GH25 family lysozyme M1 (1,4-beta-N-acetylmuramidase)
VITPQEFYNKTVGKAIDFDGAYGVQCHDLAQYYCYLLDIPREVIQCKKTKYAHDIWDLRETSGIKKYFDVITNPKDLHNGDMVIFPTSYKNTPLSHVCFYYDFGGKIKYAFGQRQGGNREARLIETLDFNQMAGAFRPKCWGSQPMNQGKHKGCDVSEWQHPDTTDISPYEYVIIRAGYAKTEDKNLDIWVKKCEQLGKPYGFYWYSYACSPEAAREEARTFIGIAKRYKPTVGLWMDEESDSYKSGKIKYTKDVITPIVVAFMEVLDAANLYCGIYSMQSWFGSVIGTNETKKWDKWVAAWGTNDGKINRDTHTMGTMLQYTSAGGLDKDITYIDLGIYDIHRNDPVDEPTQESDDTVAPEPENLEKIVSELREEIAKLKEEKAIAEAEAEACKVKLDRIRLILGEA